MLLRFVLFSGFWIFTIAPALADEPRESVGPEAAATGKTLQLTLRSQVPVADEHPGFHTTTEPVSWQADQTALIVCDVWDTHNCKNAVDRVVEMVPRLNQVIKVARDRGVTIIHAPSNCMDFYRDQPARQRASTLPLATQLPAEINSWCYQIPAEEQGEYPLDQSDGGCDDSPEEHAAWQASLAPLLKEEKWPWRRQHPGIEIDESRDYVSDQGDEIWSILEAHDISNVIMTGVHTNMCVLGRPFGLRRLVSAGKSVALMRDQTDTMYNPESAPFVSHFTGTDLIVDHIERYVCPTLTSDQLLGASPFRFKADTRPTLAIVIAEDEYETAQTLTKFAVNPLGKHFRVSLIYGDAEDRNRIPGIAAVEHADALLISVRRRVLPVAEMDMLKAFAAAGKPIIGIRTASHAFSLRKQEPPEGFDDWQELDGEVFGGNYTGHYGNSLKSTVTIADIEHPILNGIKDREFPQGWSLYQTSPLKVGAVTLMTAEVPGESPEPAAWTFVRKDGGRSFYTSLGNVDDFEQPAFRKLLEHGILWACEQPIPVP